MKSFLSLILIFGPVFSSLADLKIFAIVSGGSNVVDVLQYNPELPPRLVGATNVAITKAEAAVIRPGWSLVGGVFRDQAGAGLPASVVAKKDRESKAKAFKAIYETRKKNWDTIKVSEQADVLGQLCALIDMIVELHPELLEPKPEPGN